MLLIHFRDIMVLNFQQWTISTIEPQNVAPVLGHMEAVGGFIGTYEISDWLTLRNSQSKGSKFRKTFYTKAKIWFHELFFFFVQLYRKWFFFHYSCFESNLNGEYHENPLDNDYYRGIIWELWRGDYSLKSSKMMIRSRAFQSTWKNK